jgi:hypothetical protein
MVLITGRQLEHWHTGSMTRRATALDALEPDPYLLINLLPFISFLLPFYYLSHPTLSLLYSYLFSPIPPLFFYN